jgi:1-acyl-sn-glycerol-3-phosphate acyltransferase
LFKAVFYPGSALFVLLAPLLALAGREPLTRHIYGWARFHDWCARVLLGVRWRVEGTMPSGPALIAMKHEAMYETIAALLLLDRPAPVFKRELMDIPFWGRACRRYGGIVVEREGGARSLRAMLSEAKELIADGRPILIFPEGTRVPHGQTLPLQSGFTGLYKLLGLPVVPVAIDSGPFYHRWWKRPGIITVRFCEPIPPGLPRDEIETRVHAAINELNG